MMSYPAYGLDVVPMVSDKKIFFLTFFLLVAMASCMDSKSLNNFQSVSSKDQSSEIRSKLAQWFKG